MKNWYAKHQDKWYQVKNVEDTGKPAHERGGGNIYHLDGVDKPVHQSELQDLSLKPVGIDKYDRKEVEVDGKSELDYGTEDLDKLKDRWSKLKKATLDSSKAFLDITSQEYEEDTDEEDESADEPVEEADETPDEGEDVEEAQPAVADDQSAGNAPESDDDTPEHEELAELLRAEGYSDAEI